MDQRNQFGGMEHEARRQIRIFKTMNQRITEQERLIRLIEQETVIPEMAQDLAKKALHADLFGNKKTLLEHLYNVISLESSLLVELDIEFTYIIIEKKFLEIDTCSLWLHDENILLPAEIGVKFGEQISGTSPVHAPGRIVEFYKEAEKRFDRELPGNLQRCSLLVLEEKYPQSSYHITIRLPASILNEYTIEL
ncbi:MAG: hypothetical protein JXA44_12625 [Methanospirillaceae archaeon]|nr:hypothetical protein [Methanospirillaceae archaeon]